MKWLLPVFVVAASLGFADRLPRPEVRLGRRALACAPLVVLGLGLALAAPMALPIAAWEPVIRGGMRAVCLTAMVGRSPAPLAAMLWTLWRGAPTRPRLSGLMAGLAATLYAPHRNEDAVPFFVTCHRTGIPTAGAVGAALGPRVLRWRRWRPEEADHGGRFRHPRSEGSRPGPDGPAMDCCPSLHPRPRQAPPIGLDLLSGVPLAIGALITAAVFLIP